MGTRLQIILFFVAAYIFSWFGNLGDLIWPSDWWPVPMNPLGLIMAAPLIIGLFGGKAGLRAWWRRIIRIKAGQYDL